MKVLSVYGTIVIELVQNCIRSRELLWSLSESYLKARYKQTILGVGWAIIPPLLLMATAVLLLPRLGMVVPSTEPYPLFVYIGFWFWTFFANALSFSIPNLVQNVSLLRKVYFPREMLVLAAIVPSMLDFILGIPVLLLLMWYYHIALHLTALLLPLLFMVELFLVIGIACAAAILNVAFRDVSKFLPIVLQILLFATPVLYATSAVSTRLSAFVAWNPLSGILDTARAILMPRFPFNGFEFMVSVIGSLLVWYLGYALFKLGERMIVDIA